MGDILVEFDDFPDRRASFLGRQFDPAATKGQIVFDVMFGVIAPILCFAADPIVFKSGAFGPPMFPDYQLFTYLVSGLGISALVPWLIARKYLRSFAPVFAGIFVGGAIFSAVIGIVIFPFALIGIIFVIGFAGFMPLLTAFVYLRNGVRAFRQSELPNAGLKNLIAVLSMALVIGFPALISYQVLSFISISVRQIVQGNAMEAQVAIDRLSWIPYLPKGSFNPVVTAYQSESDPQKKDLLRKYYRDATGEDIEAQLDILSD